MLSIVTAPSPLLKSKSRPVREDEFGADLDVVMDAMVVVLNEERGAGLAGVQVGDLRQIILVCLGPANVPEKMVNPKLVKVSSIRSASEEGCLSFPNKLSRPISRPRQVTVEYRTPFGEQRVVVLSGFEARCVQHEIDHLNGKTIL